MSQPPKSTILAPAARWVSLRMVFFVMGREGFELRGAHYSCGGVGPSVDSSLGRKAEAMAFTFLLDASREPTHVRVCFVRRPWQPSYFSLLVQREVTKRKTPSRPRFAGRPARQTARAGYGVRLGHIRVPCANARASV